MMVNKGYFCINKGYFCKLGEVDAHIWRYLGMICTRTCHQGTLSKSFRHDLHTDLSSPRAHCQNKNKSHCQYCLYMEAGMICIRTCHQGTLSKSFRHDLHTDLSSLFKVSMYTLSQFIVFSSENNSVIPPHSCQHFLDVAIS